MLGNVCRTVNRCFLAYEQKRRKKRCLKVPTAPLTPETPSVNDEETFSFRRLHHISVYFFKKKSVYMERQT